MNAHAMVDVDEAMETAAQEIASNVVNLEPETELERHARIHRGIIAQQEKRAAELLENGKRLAGVRKTFRKELRDKYLAELEAQKQEEAVGKAFTLSAIATAQCLIEISKAAVARLEAAIEVA